MNLFLKVLTICRRAQAWFSYILFIARYSTDYFAEKHKLLTTSDICACNWVLNIDTWHFVITNTHSFVFVLDILKHT